MLELSVFRRRILARLPAEEEAEGKSTGHFELEVDIHQSRGQDYAVTERTEL